MDAYIYQAALYCEGCAERIRQRLQADGVPVSDDSDDYPQGPYANGGGEADHPQHCSGCNAFLENPLTADGVKYVAGAIVAGLGTLTTMEGKREVSPTIGAWAAFYGLDSVTGLIEAIGAGQ